MINRKEAPVIQPIDVSSFLMPESFTLSNGAVCKFYDAPVSDISRISILFDAGSIYETKKLQAFFSYQLLKQGSESKSSQKIAELLDFYGSYTEMEVMKDYTCFTIYTLNKYANEILQVIAELITSPGFHESDFSVYQNKQKQRFTVNMEKVSGMARNKFPSLLFGENHPYGGEILLNNYNELTLEDCKEFYKSNISNMPFTVIVAGSVNKNLIQVIDNSLGKIKISKALNILPKATFDTTNYQAKKHQLNKNDAIQNAILIGTPLFNRKHQDYYALMITSTLLGGYFGSRLMSNIREDKGYTYGIGSAVAAYKNNGYFIISTEVGADVSSLALIEIYKEIEKLCNDNVSESELQTVKSFMLGDLLRDMDGPFALADRSKNMHLNDLPDTYYPDFANAIKNITVNEILSVSQRYLAVNNLTELVVGKV